MRMRLCACAVMLIAASAHAEEPATTRSATSGVEAVKGFPVAVWLQDPKNVERFKAIGINLYVGLWQGPTEAQLTTLEKAGMPVFCGQNAEGLKPRWRQEIAGWLQDDEPDNAQSLGEGKGYGPPMAPEKIVERYQAMKAADRERPVMLNLGQGVAWDGWYGRGVRTNHPEDYPLYARGGDIVSFDIYPVTHENKEVAGKLWYVGQGTQRLVKWTEARKPVWACIECSHIGNAARKPTPEQVRVEVWMAITHGARGIIYFVHQFAPRFVEAGIFEDAEMPRAVGQINRQIQELAPAIYSQEAVEAATVEGDAGMALLTRRLGATTYVFAVGISEANVKATVNLKGAVGTVEVIGEGRRIPIEAGKWSDEFAGYQVHLYRVTPR